VILDRSSFVVNLVLSFYVVHNLLEYKHVCSCNRATRKRLLKGVAMKVADMVKEMKKSRKGRSNMGGC
jgi:NAD(P)H-nitrite reductase large subunit